MSNIAKYAKIRLDPTPMTYMEKALYLSFVGLTSKGQMDLQKKHKDPYRFATDVMAAVPGFISMDEARISIEKYNQEWEEASHVKS